MKESKLAIAAGLIVLTLIVSKILKMIKARTIATYDRSGFRPGFNPKSEAQAALDAFKGIDWSSKKNDVLVRMWDYSDDELKAVYNAYGDQSKTSLTADIKDEWIWGRNVNRVIDRLEGLRLP